MSRRAERRAIAGLVILTALLRVGLIFAVSHAHPERMITHDTIEYVGPARSLLHDGDYDRNPETSAPEFQRTPGYPAFVTAVYWATDESDTAVVVVQAALSGLSVLLAYLLARRLTASGVVALAAGILVAVDPLTTSQAGLVATETVATVFVMLTVWCGVRMVQSRYSPRWAFAMAVSLVAATYVRPTTYYLPLVIIGLLGVVAMKDRPTRAAIARSAAAFAVPCFVLLGAWSVHNQAEVGSWRFSSIDSTNLYWYRAAAVIAARDGTDREAVQMELTERISGLRTVDLDGEDYSGGVPPPGWEHRQAEYYGRAQNEALEILWGEPRLTAREVARSLYGQVVQSGWATASKFFFGDTLGIAAVGLPIVWATQALGVFGAVVALRRSAAERVAHLMAMSLVLHTFLVSTLGADGANGYRMRIPVWPIWCIYAVIGARELVSLWNGASRTAPAPEGDSAS